ncbi:RadC family protein [Compostibacter hankyongensis]|uniref:DNA repair protein RadC n=1 Tax=Compostibacter hankyongensis TaxID=1007089 RepID=A0ABP8FHY8_9BACT
MAEDILQPPAIKPLSGIKTWAKDDRPREKMLLKGPQALSNAELLAILINSGNRGKSALDLARELLADVEQQLVLLGRIPVKDFMKKKGIGSAKAITIAAALELGRRRQAGSLLDKPVIRTSRDAAAMLQPLLADLKHEVFAVLFLSRSNRVGHFEVLSNGGTTSTVVDTKIVLRKTLEHDAVSILLAHNHPSGSLQPSGADHHLTKKIASAAALLDIKVLDHIIVSHSGFFSFADEGLL